MYVTRVEVVEGQEVEGVLTASMCFGFTNSGAPLLRDLCRCVWLQGRHGGSMTADYLEQNDDGDYDETNLSEMKARIRSGGGRNTRTSNRAR